MTIQWVEGFEIDRHSFALDRAYHGVAKTRFNRYIEPGRSGGFFLRVSQDATPFFFTIEDGGVKDLNPNNIETGILGFAFRADFLADHKGKAFPLWSVRNQSSLPAALTHLLLGIVIASDGKSYEYIVTRADLTVLGTTSASLQNNEWYYVEMKFKIHTSTGTIDIEIDGSSEMALTGQNTSIGAGVWGHFNLAIPVSATTSYIDIDDIYIVSAEATNPDFLGSILIEQKWPTGESVATSGPYNDWTLFGSSVSQRWQAVDDSQGGAIDDDLRYLEAKLNDLKQTFTMIPHVFIDDTSILATTWNIDARLVANGSKNLAPLFWESVGGLVTGSNVAINSTSYMRRKVINEAALSSGFTLDVASASEWGFETKA